MVILVNVHIRKYYWYVIRIVVYIEKERVVLITIKSDLFIKIIAMLQNFTQYSKFLYFKNRITIKTTQQLPPSHNNWVPGFLAVVYQLIWVSYESLLLSVCTDGCRSDHRLIKVNVKGWSPYRVDALELSGCPDV